jgi:hypothetical protein
MGQAELLPTAPIIHLNNMYRTDPTFSLSAIMCVASHGHWTKGKIYWATASDIYSMYEYDIVRTLYGTYITKLNEIKTS